jgi:hypothetical protein
MKKKASTQDATAMRGGVAPKTVDQYLAGIPEPAPSTVKQIRSVIRSSVPAETTEVISYGIAMFKYGGNAGGIRGVQEPLQPFSDGVGCDREVRKGT